MTFFMPGVGGTELFSFPPHSARSQLWAPFMNMHEIRYDIALLPLIILSSDLCSRKLPSMASESKCSLKTNKTTQNKKTTSFHLSFFYLTGIKYSDVWARVREGAEEGRKGEGVSSAENRVSPCVNGPACWEPKVVGVTVRKWPWM